MILHVCCIMHGVKIKSQMFIRCPPAKQHKKQNKTTYSRDWEGMPSLINFQSSSLTFYLVSPPVSSPHPYFSSEKWLPLHPSYHSLISGYKSMKLGDWATIIMLRLTANHPLPLWWIIQSSKVMQVQNAKLECALERWPWSQENWKRRKQEEMLDVYFKMK